MIITKLINQNITSFLHLIYNLSCFLVLNVYTIYLSIDCLVFSVDDSRRIKIILRISVINQIPTRFPNRKITRYSHFELIHLAKKNHCCWLCCLTHSAVGSTLKRKSTPSGDTRSLRYSHIPLQEHS